MSIFSLQTQTKLLKSIIIADMAHDAVALTNTISEEWVLSNGEYRRPFNDKLYELCFDIVHQIKRRQLDHVVRMGIIPPFCKFLLHYPPAGGRARTRLIVSWKMQIEWSSIRTELRAV